MKKETKKAPIIRFRGFTDDWEQRKLEDIVDKAVDNRGKTPPISEEGIHPLIEVASLGNGTPDYTKVTKYLDDETFESALRDYIKEGDILFSTVGSIGLVSLMDSREDAAIAQNIVAFRAKENNDSKFIYAMLSTEENQYKAWRIVMGAIQPSIKVSQLIHVEYCVSQNLEEQRKIGEYFTNLDHLITLHQRKLDQLKKLKKYFLQNMFPAKGEKVPRIRFKGFTGDWEQKKLIDVCDYVDYRGKTPSKTTSGIFLVTAKNIKDGYIDYKASQEYISENDYDEVMHRGKPKIGDVLITTEAPCGNVAQVNKENIALAQRIIKYRGHSHVMDNAYLKYYLLSPEFQEILYAKSSGGTVQGIKGSILHKQKISFPKYEEQVKIGQYLDDLDNLITLHQHKLEQLQTMKKFMLQNLFI
ncbi:restriction endonuclease subunit S [Megasphaera elsdenii]|uniref:restriction endonuclease subunit S n=1 Tax=Megasphaera elsdenii TaxID=907 RepID=UPI00242BCC89|nr:restriction endonuclease subunit S [Megasphaera elsdenii]